MPRPKKPDGERYVKIQLYVHPDNAAMLKDAAEKSGHTLSGTIVYYSILGLKLADRYPQGDDA